MIGGMVVTVKDGKHPFKRSSLDELVMRVIHDLKGLCAVSTRNNLDMRTWETVLDADVVEVKWFSLGALADNKHAVVGWAGSLFALKRPGLPLARMTISAHLAPAQRGCSLESERHRIARQDNPFQAPRLCAVKTLLGA